MSTHIEQPLLCNNHFLCSTFLALTFLLTGCTGSSSTGDESGEETTEEEGGETFEEEGGEGTGEGGGQPPGGNCKSDEDCANPTPDGSGCAVAICDMDTLTCSVQPREDGAACDDGDGCLTGDTCLNGDCQAGTTPACDSPDACASCPDVCTCPSECGDGSCDADETTDTCPQDCSPPILEVCGDGECTLSESCANCPEDCGECPTTCGNGTCDDGEDCTNCEADCGDCPDVCGDGICAPSEDCSSCTADCGECPAGCGNGSCDNGEDCTNCAADCGACPDSCGDGTCGAAEDCLSCEADCGACVVCGDNVCDGEESCLTCAADCGECACTPSTEPGLPPTGNAICRVHGCAGEKVDCKLLIARDDISGESATGLQAVVQYDPTLLELDNFYDNKCLAVDFCTEVSLAKQGSQTNNTGHSFSASPAGETPCVSPPCLWNGTIKLLIFNLAGSVTLTEAFLDNANQVVGDAEFGWARFTLLHDISIEEATAVSLADGEPDDLVAVGPSLVELPATIVDGVIITEGF